MSNKALEAYQQQKRATTVCYVCGAPATQWIRSASQHFSAPRCTKDGDELVEYFHAQGVTDVTVDAIGAAVPA